MMDLWKKGFLLSMQIATVGAILSLLYLPVVLAAGLAPERMREPARIGAHVVWLIYGPILLHLATRRWITFEWKLK